MDANDGEVIALLRKILEVLKSIDEKLDEIGKSEEKDKEEVKLDPVMLLELPDKLRTTAMALIKLERANASEVARITGRGRAIESHYLNTLVRMGYARKRREGRRVVYEILS